MNVLFDGIFQLISSRTWDIINGGNGIFLISKSVSVVFNKHVIFFHLLFVVFFWLWIGPFLLRFDNVCDHFLKLFIVKRHFSFSLNFWKWFARFRRSRMIVGAWSWDGCSSLFHLRIDSFSSLIFKDTSRFDVLNLLLYLLLLSFLGKIRVINKSFILTGLHSKQSLFFVDLLRDLLYQLVLRFIEWEATVEFGLFENGGLIMLILLVVMKQILLFFGH
jgi:hypothetical protein